MTAETPVVVAVLNPGEILMLAALVALVFGSTQIPKLARSLGQAQREFRAGQEEGVSPETPSSKKAEADPNKSQSDKPAAE